MTRPRAWDHHPLCPGGCGQLADECTCPRPNPLGSMRIEGTQGHHLEYDCPVCGSGGFGDCVCLSPEHAPTVAAALASTPRGVQAILDALVQAGALTEEIIHEAVLLDGAPIPARYGPSVTRLVTPWEVQP